MKPFVVLRVPVALDENRAPVRRRQYATTGTTIVAECETATEAEATVGDLQRGDVKHHYYGLELRYVGDPERKTAMTCRAKPRQPKPRLQVVSNPVHQLEHKKG